MVDYNTPMDVFTHFDEPLHALWDAAMTHESVPWPFFTFTWHQHWHDHFSDNEQLMIMSDTKNQVIIPVSIRDRTAHFTGGEEIADYLDAVGTSTHKAAAWQEAVLLLKEQGVSALLLRNIPEGSPTIDALLPLTDVQITQEDTTPILTLPDSFDDYLSSLDRKDRHELKRKMKKFEAEHPALSFVPRTGNSTDMPSLLRLMRLDTDKAAFLTREMTGFFETLPSVFPGDIWQFVLMQQDTIIATTLAFRVRDSLLLYNSGFDPDYPGAGWYIKAKTINWAIEQSVRSYNFLQGNERYKYDLGAKDSAVYRISVPL